MYFNGWLLNYLLCALWWLNSHVLYFTVNKFEVSKIFILFIKINQHLAMMYSIDQKWH